MMGWIVMLVLATATALLLWRFAGFRGATLQLLAAALLVAMAGYAWQGRPGLPGQSAAAQPRAERPDTPFAVLRPEFFGRFTAAERWLILADSYQRRGNTAEAVAAVRTGIRRNPDNLALWIGLGNALVQHGGGAMSPAAELAYRRAAAIAPGHPAPHFFYGMSLIEGGQIEEAEAVWQGLLANGPPGAWRGLVESRLALLEQLRAAMREGRMPPPAAAIP